VSRSLKELRRRPVVDTSTAETIGRVEGAHLDPGHSRVMGFAVDGRTDGVLPLSQVQAIGPDAVTVASQSAVRSDEVTDLPLDGAVRGRRVLDDGGTELGTLDDVLMAEDGTIDTVVVDGVEHPTRLLGIGSYAVVVARG
jgi:uncharacterized protein YrrD